MSLTMSNTASGCANLSAFSDILFSSSDFVVNHSATIFAVSLGLRVNTPAPLSTTYGTLPFSCCFYHTSTSESTSNGRNNKRKHNSTTHLSWDIVVENYGKPSDQCFCYCTWSSLKISTNQWPYLLTITAYEGWNQEQITITCFCYDAVTGSHPFGHLGLKSSDLQNQETKFQWVALRYAHLHNVQKPRSNLPLLESSTREIRGWILNSYSDHIWWLIAQLVSQLLYRKVILPKPLQFSWQGPFLHHPPSAKLLAKWDPTRVHLSIDPVVKDRVSTNNERRRKITLIISLTFIYTFTRTALAKEGLMGKPKTRIWDSSRPSRAAFFATSSEGQ